MKREIICSGTILALFSAERGALEKGVNLNDATSLVKGKLGLSSPFLIGFTGALFSWQF